MKSIGVTSSDPNENRLSNKTEVEIAFKICKVFSKVKLICHIFEFLIRILNFFL